VVVLCVEQDLPRGFNRHADAGIDTGENGLLGIGEIA
jgi:hypothetical protein